MCSTEMSKVANADIKEFVAKEKFEIVLSAPVPAFTHEFWSGRQGEADEKKRGGGSSACSADFFWRNLGPTKNLS